MWAGEVALHGQVWRRALLLLLQTAADGEAGRGRCAAAGCRRAGANRSHIRASSWNMSGCCNSSRWRRCRVRKAARSCSCCVRPRLDRVSTWPLTAPVHMLLAILLVRNHVASASPFLPIRSSATPWLEVCITLHSGSVYGRFPPHWSSHGRR